VELVGRQWCGAGLEDLVRGHAGVGQVDSGVGGRLGFEAPAFGERSGVDGVEGELVNLARGADFRVGFVAGDG
jgi:hypothetical protein